MVSGVNGLLASGGGGSIGGLSFGISLDKGGSTEGFFSRDSCHGSSILFLSLVVFSSSIVLGEGGGNGGGVPFFRLTDPWPISILVILRFIGIFKGCFMFLSSLFASPLLFLASLGI